MSDLGEERNMVPPGEPVEPPAEGTVQPGQETTPPAAAPAQASDDDRLMAGLAWLTLVILQLPILSVVMLLVETTKNRPFQRYHAVTSTIFWVAAIVYEILAVIVYTILTVISLGCLGLFLWIIFFLPHLAGLYFAYKGYKGDWIEIPFISDFARKQNWV